MPPDEAILDFVARQAEPIRENLYLPIFWGFYDGPVDGDMDFKKLAEDVLLSGPSLQHIYRIAYAIGGLDYSLSQSMVETEIALQSMPEEAKMSPGIQRVILSAPLRRKYFEQAAKDWFSLRQSVLSYEALRKFEATLFVAYRD